MREIADYLVSLKESIDELKSVTGCWKKVWPEALSNPWDFHNQQDRIICLSNSAVMKCDRNCMSVHSVGVNAHVQRRGVNTCSLHLKWSLELCNQNVK